jgi:hypothetical protein
MTGGKASRNCFKGAPPMTFQTERTLIDRLAFAYNGENDTEVRITLKRLIYVLSVAILLLAAGIAVIMVLGQEDDDDSASPPISAALREQLDELDLTAARIRELDARSLVIRVFPTSAQVAEYFQTTLAEEVTPDVLYEAIQFYRAFDFIEEDIDLLQIYTDLLISQVAGYYDPEANTMNVLLFSEEELGDSLPILEQIFYVHEYTHALQDQHYDLTGFYEAVEEMDDALLARQALVEGDATFVMQLFLTEVVAANPLAALSILTSDVVANAEIPPGTPDILEAELTMPYLEGLTFVTALYEAGGITAIDAAFSNPPESTEQILHPTRYLNDDQPMAVTLASVEPADVLGSGWDQVINGTMGEFYLREYLETQLSGGDAADAAAGWGGDQYALFHNEAADQHAWIMRLAWDSSDERTEFVGLYNEFVRSRYDGRAETARFDTAECWVGAQDAICRQIDGDSVVITYAPDVELSMALMSEQGG